MRTPAPPWKMSETPATFRRPPPTLGQHTDEILSENGNPEALSLTEPKQPGYCYVSQGDSKTLATDPARVASFFLLSMFPSDRQTSRRLKLPPSARPGRSSERHLGALLRLGKNVILQWRDETMASSAQNRRALARARAAADLRASQTTGNASLWWALN